MNYQQSQTGRALAILTTGEVAGARLDLSNVKDAKVGVDLSFTLGSLTNVTVRFYVSMDGTTYVPIYQPTVISEVITANATRAYVLPALHGWKFFRVSVQGSGTTTNSLCAFTYRFLKRGAL